MRYTIGCKITDKKTGESEETLISIILNSVCTFYMNKNKEKFPASLMKCPPCQADSRKTKHSVKCSRLSSSRAGISYAASHIAALSSYESPLEFPETKDERHTNQTGRIDTAATPLRTMLWGVFLNKKDNKRRKIFSV